MPVCQRPRMRTRTRGPALMLRTYCDRSPELRHQPERVADPAPTDRGTAGQAGAAPRRFQQGLQRQTAHHGIERALEGSDGPVLALGVAWQGFTVR
ncbi:hypothetical protein GCM10022403_097770 [Streptomyces coacervatus]|uniref:Uncharacterized protein n=1 Tax=Streptomyces coacervatus TaxID=647381 RepID=A0ABP7JPN9_9ACTN